jgi:TonB family protein
MTLAVVLTMLLAQAASPSPSASSSCFHDAQIVKADYPRDFEPAGEGPLAATVLVVVGPDGSVRKASISKSSGDLAFDMASIRAAKASKYRAKVASCQPVEGTIPFRTTLTPGWAPGGTPTPRPHYEWVGAAKSLGLSSFD